MSVHKTPCRIRIYLIRVVLVQQTPCERPNTNKHPCDREIRVQKNIRVIRILTSLRSVGLQRISCSKSRVPHVSATPRTKIREIRVRIKTEKDPRAKTIR